MRRLSALVVALVLVLLGAVTSPAAATPDPGAGATGDSQDQQDSHLDALVPTLDWQPCGPGQAFRCATAEVPADYDNPQGRTTTIALTKLPASGRADRRLGSVFVNPGGPGGSGVDFVQQTAPFVYAPEVYRRYDIVGFDPRGVVRSDPATCFPTLRAENAFLARTEPYPINRYEEFRHTALWAELAVRCQTTSPGRFSVASTANVARDLELLRLAVHDPVLNYIGYSYGTYLGATYAALFPGRVGRFVLDATVDPVAWSGTGTGDAAPTVPFGIRIRQGLGADETFGEFLRLCRQAGPAGCSLAAFGDPAVVVSRVLDQLLQSPIVLPDGTELTQQLAVAMTFQALYAPAFWPEMADAYSALAATLVKPAEIAAALARTRSALGARLRGQDYPSIGGGLASLCVDTARSGQVARYSALADREDARYPYFGRFRAWTGLPCELWTTRDEDRFTGPWQQRTTAPVLVIGTRFDPATPYLQTRPYADLWPDARVLTLDGWGHTILGKSSCADQAVAAYLVNGRRPADGATCAPDSVPFTTPRGTARPQVPPGLPLDW